MIYIYCVLKHCELMRIIKSLQHVRIRYSNDTKHDLPFEMELMYVYLSYSPQKIQRYTSGMILNDVF